MASELTKRFKNFPGDFVIENMEFESLKIIQSWFGNQSCQIDITSFLKLNGCKYTKILHLIQDLESKFRYFLPTLFQESGWVHFYTSVNENDESKI